jgi:hypothetical protein
MGGDHDAASSSNAGGNCAGLTNPIAITDDNLLSVSNVFAGEFLSTSPVDALNPVQKAFAWAPSKREGRQLRRP